jgi:hypothetical protein
MSKEDAAKLESAALFALLICASVFLLTATVGVILWIMNNL